MSPTPRILLIVLSALLLPAALGCSGIGASDASVERVCSAVTRVVDGDTFKIAVGAGKEDTVRLIGVDTPESVKPGSPVEPYGIEASDFAKELLTDQTVCLEWDVEERDRYGRLLAYAYLADGTFVNERLLAEGYATVLTIPPNVKHADRFVEVQREARDAGRGLWGDPDAAGGEGGSGTAVPGGGSGSAAADGGPGSGLGSGASAPGASAKPEGPAGPDRDCSDFATQAEAQAFFEAAGGPDRDPHRLDGDGDRIACEGL